LYIAVLKGLISRKNEDRIILARKPGGKKTLAISRLRWEENLNPYPANLEKIVS
jgi:hypothetical protein